MLRILTENKNRTSIEDELTRRGIDFTIYETEGTWKGEKEHSLIIEIEGKARTEVFNTAETIRLMNEQEAVYVQEIPTVVYEITKEGRSCLTL